MDRKDDRMTIDRQRDEDLAVTDRSIEIRRRKRKIVHIIHNTTWIMESLGLIIGFVFQQILCSETNPNICANLIFIQNLINAKTLVPFTHLFNEHRIKIIILERGWIFAMKSALQFNIVPRVAPVVPNLSTGNTERSRQGNVSMDILRKYPKQECIDPTDSTPEAFKNNKIANGADIMENDSSDLPSQVKTR